MKTHVARHAPAAFMMLVVACSNAPEPRTARPETLVDTLYIEGMPDVARATLVRAPQEFDMPFSTYLPQGMNVEYRTDSSGAAVRFVAAFGGVVEPQAYLQVRKHPLATSAQQARDVVSAFLAGKTVRPADAPDWALDVHAFDYEDHAGIAYTGRIMLARHGPRFLDVVQHYPPEYGDGLGPRFHSILRHWRWEDTGAPLIGDSGARHVP